MQPLRDQPIHRKLTGTLLGTSAVVLLVATFSFCIEGWFSFRDEMMRNMQIQAETMAESVQPLLMFEDAAEAGKTLSVLKADPHIVTACILNKEGKLFAQYRRRDATESQLQITAHVGMSGFHGNHLEISFPIQSEGKPIGTLFLQRDLTEIRDRQIRSVLIAAGVLAATLGLAFWLAAVARRFLSSPIERLAVAVQRVSADKDYTVRVASDTRDELGTLVQAFNGMLGRIEQREAELRLNAERMQTLLKLNQMTDATLREITDFALEEAVRLTQSQIGYLAFMNDDETVLAMHAWSRQAMRECAIIDKPILYNVKDTGLWGEAVRQRCAVITNDYAAPNPRKKGYPAGHVAVRRHMNTPVIVGGRIVLVAGVGNKDHDYDETDVQQLTLLMEGMWRLIERQRAEQEIRRFNAELEQRIRERTADLEASNKELEAFSYSVSHDLRAPLRAINGFASMLVEDHAKQLDDEGRRKLATVSSEANRMGKLIDDLLAFSRLGRQAMQIGAVDMGALAQTAYNACAAQAAGRNIRLTLRPMPPAQGDASLIAQVWANLISNAVKYTKAKPVAEIEIAAEARDSGVVYLVRDNGAGFDMEYVHKLFGVFQRLHSDAEFEGTGVGLALTQRIIRRHGGRVWAEGKVNEGATFYFALPATPPAS
jgi:signal transduction histidine kinase